MKKLAMMMLALVMMSGCGELDDLTCEPDNAPRRFVHRNARGGCPDSELLNGHQYVFQGANQNSCGIIEVFEEEQLEDTGCVVHTRYAGYLGDEGPINMVSQVYFKCPQYNCFINSDIDVYPY